MSMRPAKDRPEPFHPELGAGRFIPRVTARPPRFFPFRFSLPSRPSTPEVKVRTENVSGPAGRIGLRVYRPTDSSGATGALYWIHGGGLVAGAPEQDQAQHFRVARERGVTVVASAYRLAPEHPAPAALDDVVAGYRAVIEEAGRFGVDPARVAIGGASAGGGLAAAACQRLLDEGGPLPVAQILVYPMLDDRTALRTDIDERHIRIWTNKSNLNGWASYLGRAPGAESVPPYSVPARREDLRGLPPAWIGVGTLDLFHDEDVAYAERLRSAGVPCDLEVVPGAFHGFDGVFPRAGVVRRFADSWGGLLQARVGATHDGMSGGSSGSTPS